MMKASGVASEFRYAIRKLSYTGEPIDSATLDFVDATFHVPVGSMYGTTEVGVILVNYPGAEDFVVKPGSLGKAVPGTRVEIQRADGSAAAPGESARSRCGAAMPGSPPRISAMSTPTAISIMTAAPTTSSSRRAGR